MNGLSRAVAALAVTAVAAVLAAGVHAQTSWAPAQKIDEINGNNSEVNTTSLDGCPIQSPDGLSLYMASNRPGGRGGLDIWVATRPRTSSPWGAPANLGEPVNSAFDDFCPTPVGKTGLFFVSREALPGACGQGDIYFTHRHPVSGWAEPERLPCAPAGPNSELDEQGPSYVSAKGMKLLFFSRSSVSPLVPGDVFVSSRSKKARFGPAVSLPALNDPAANDIQPNVREDGLEVVFSSNRTGSAGAQDIWASTRQRVGDPWSPPINLGAAVNTTASETRPSLSKDGRQLLYGRAPGSEGNSDIYVTTR